MRVRVESCWERECRCWCRKVERVERESEIRVREAVSLVILKWDVHWEISWEGLLVLCLEGWWVRVVCGMRGTYGGGIFVEEHFG